MFTELIIALLALMLVGAVILVLRLRRKLRQMERARSQAEHEAAARRQDLEYRTALLETLKGMTDDAWVVVGREGQVIFTNEVAELLFGKPNRGTTVMQWAREYRLADMVERSLRGEQLPALPLNFGGQEYRALSRPLLQDGHPVGVILNLRDISELQRLGRARREFVANISHDLRTPLASIQLLIDTIVANGWQHPEDMHQMLRKINLELDVLNQLAQEMLDLSLIESGRIPLKLQPVLLLPLVERTVARLSPQAEYKGLALVLDIPVETTVLADETMIGRVLTNLIHNAIKFTEHGSVRVTAANEQSPEGPLVKIGVHDTGVGIPSGDAGRVFERFYKADRSRSRGGTGLGLAIARHIVEGHGGAIWAESAEGEGASFFFTLPTAE